MFWSIWISILKAFLPKCGFPQEDGYVFNIVLPGFAWTIGELGGRLAPSCDCQGAPWEQAGKPPYSGLPSGKAIGGRPKLLSETHLNLLQIDGGVPEFPSCTRDGMVWNWTMFKMHTTSLSPWPRKKTLNKSLIDYLALILVLGGLSVMITKGSSLSHGTVT